MPVQVNPCLFYDTGYPDKHLVLDFDAFQQMVSFLSYSPILVFDFETSGVDWFRDSVAVGIGLGGYDSANKLQKYYVPFRHATGEKQLSIADIGPSLSILLSNSNTLKVAHNIKFDEHFANKEGWKINGPRYDTMIAARLYDENRSAALKIRAVEDLLRPEANEYEKKIDLEIYRLAKEHGMHLDEYRSQYGYSQIHIPLLGTYCCFDIEFTEQLYLFYEKVGISRAYPRIWSEEMGLTGELTKMESHGVPINTDYLILLKDRLGGVLAGIEDSITHQLGGFKFNIASDAELRDMLTNRLGISLYKLTKKKQLAVDKEVLTEFVGAHPVLQQIIDWKEAEKLYSTYTDSILERLDSQNILHTDLQQVGTIASRLSCRNPNLQNQPSDSDKRSKLFSGKSLEDGGIDPWSIRRAYIVRKGIDPSDKWVRLYFDYSQIELRVLAFYSRDPVLVEAYRTGEDIHDRTSLEVFGTKEKAKRRLAKVINFGSTYCMSEIGYAAQIGIPINEARAHLDRFYKQYAGIASFRLKFWGEVKRNKGFFQNLFGRPRRIPEINSSEDYERTKAERQAIAAIIQGTAGELTKISLVRIGKFLEEENLPAYPVLTVHDEIQVDCHVSVMAKVVRGIKALMENFPEFDPIPIIVSVEYSTTNWAEKKKVPL